jgi:hypothetical protein
VWEDRTIVSLAFDVARDRLAPGGAAGSDDHGAASGQRAVILDAAPGPAILTVRRTAPEDVQDRQVYLSVDGEAWVTLLYGREATRELGPGPHTLKANNTLVRKTVTFDARPGEHVRFQCINRTHWTGMLFMAFLGAAVLTVHLEREPAG